MNYTITTTKFQQILNHHLTQVSYNYYYRALQIGKTRLYQTRGNMLIKGNRETEYKKAGITNYIVLEVANTRFAITCDYSPFMRWLTESYANFVSHNEPHLCLNIGFTRLPLGSNSGPFLSITRNGSRYEHGELKMDVTCSHPTNFYGYMLQNSLRCTLAVKQPPDLLFHSSGVVHNEVAYLFVGISGSGKSTVCRLLAEEADFTVIHDEAVAITQNEKGIYAWSTPFRGEVPVIKNSSAPIRAIFFLRQDQTNHAIRLNARKSLMLLYQNMIPPLVPKNGDLEVEPTESLKQVLKLAECIPCYELHFKPEYSVWEYISSL